MNNNKFNADEFKTELKQNFAISSSHSSILALLDKHMKSV